MAPAGLRARVAAAAAVAIAVAVAILGAAIVTVLGRDLHSSLDDALRSRAVDVARLSASTPSLLVAPALAAGLATLLSARALRPLSRRASGARKIERSGDASERFPVAPTHDEVEELAATLNAMLASLERAREAERRFVGDASHELRTPLTALLGNVSYLSRHGATTQLIADLEADAGRLATLADDLLTLSREEAREPAHDVVWLDELARAAGDSRTVDVIASGPVPVRGYRAALER